MLHSHFHMSARVKKSEEAFVFSVCVCVCAHVCVCVCVCVHMLECGLLLSEGNLPRRITKRPSYKFVSSVLSFYVPVDAIPQVEQIRRHINFKPMPADNKLIKVVCYAKLQ